ncbi:MAG: hypothetical protein ACREYB_12645, partial [Casimicrobiaceae bacterium]
MPRHLRHLCTIFCPENVFGGVADAAELLDLTGLPLSELVTFRPSRLALHEVLIRVTADLSVPDGTRVEDLGINFRQITRAILVGYIEPRRDAIASAYAELRRRIGERVDAELVALFPPPVPKEAPAAQRHGSVLGTIFAARRTRTAAATAAGAATGAAERGALAGWESKAHAAGDGMSKAVYRALTRVVSALLVRHGGIWGSREMIAGVAAGIACNDFGSDEIGRMIAPW